LFNQRELPPGLSKRDEKILRSVRRRAHYLDKGFKVGPFRFGWTFWIGEFEVSTLLSRRLSEPRFDLTTGLVPFAGDIADASLNYFLVVRKARQAEIPGWLLQKMLRNNLVSVAAGLIPVAGDVILATFKANSRNAFLLEEYLRIRGEEELKVLAGRKKDVNPQDAVQVKPGAGVTEGEVVEGAPVKRGLTGMFSRNKSTAKGTAKGKEVATTSATPAATSTPADAKTDTVKSTLPSKIGILNASTKAD
jgi:hypothetical protein